MKASTLARWCALASLFLMFSCGDILVLPQPGQSDQNNDQNTTTSPNNGESDSSDGDRDTLKDDNGDNNQGFAPGASLDGLVSCGSESLSKTEPSQDPEDPAQLKLGELVGGRFSEDASNYWKIDLDSGDYTIAIDLISPDSDSDKLDVEIHLVDEDGKELDEVLDEYFYSRKRVRIADVMKVTGDKTLYLKVKGDGVTDYFLMIEQEDKQIQVPFFRDCPEVKKYEIGKEIELDRDDIEENSGFWYFYVELPAGDYKIKVRSVQNGSDKQDIEVDSLSPDHAGLNDRVEYIDDYKYRDKDYIETKDISLAVKKKMLMRVHARAESQNTFVIEER